MSKKNKFQIYCILDINSPCLENTYTDDILSEIDKSSYTLEWEESLEYVQTDKITYRGENVLDIRKDVSRADLLLYIQVIIIL